MCGTRYSHLAFLSLFLVLMFRVLSTVLSLRFSFRFVFTSRDASKSGNDDEEEEDHSAGKKKKKKEHERMNVHAPAFVPRKRRGQEEEPRRTDANDADDAEGKDARTLGKNHFDESSTPPLPPLHRQSGSHPLSNECSSIEPNEFWEQHVRGRLVVAEDVESRRLRLRVHHHVGQGRQSVDAMMRNGEFRGSSKVDRGST